MDVNFYRSTETYPDLTQIKRTIPKRISPSYDGAHLNTGHGKIVRSIQGGQNGRSHQRNLLDTMRTMLPPKFLHVLNVKETIEALFGP